MNFTFLSSAQETFSNIDHILCHKSSLDKFKKTEIISSILSDHNAVKLDVNSKRKTVKNTNIWRLNSTLLNNQQITEEIKTEIKVCTETNENENNNPKSMGFSESAKGKIHSNTSLPQKNKRKSNKQPNFTPKATKKRHQIQ